MQERGKPPGAPLAVPVPDPAAPADDGNARPGVVAATPGDDAVRLVVSSARTVRQDQGTRALRHHGLLLQAVQHVQVHRVRLLGGRQGQHQDHSRSSIGVSPQHLPPPGLPGPHSEVLLCVLHVEDCHVEKKLRVTMARATRQAGPVIMH